MPTLNPDKLKIGYVILVATPKLAIRAFQEEVGRGDSSKWTHVAGSLGGYDAVEANMPRSRVVNLQKEYVDKGFEIKVMRRRGQPEQKRYKVALWWATMNNLPYDILQFFWFPLSIICGKIGVVLHNLFSSHRRFLCSELIATGFYKEGDYLFGKPAENVLPADFDNPKLFEEVKDIWFFLFKKILMPACRRQGKIGGNMKRLAFFVLTAAIIAGTGAVTIISEAAGIAIKEGSKVAFDYTLTVDGKVMDSSQGRKPLEFTEGDGKIISGLARQLIGMHAGEENTIVVAPQEAYGNHDPAAIKEVPMSSFPADMKPAAGMTITAKSPQGQAFPVKIAEVKKDSLMIDFNHPLAGKTLTFKVKIVSVT